MTVIIGALLDDGRRIIMGDGNVIGGGGAVVATQFAKVASVDSTMKSRRAILGVSGSPAHLLPVSEAVRSALNVPQPSVEDLFYRLNHEFQRMPSIKPDYNAVIWMPFEDEVTKKPVWKLLTVTDDHFVRQSERAWAACGSGGPEARAALLGLQYSKVAPPMWCPTSDELMIAYDVACALDAYCGGVISTVEC